MQRDLGQVVAAGVIEHLFAGGGGGETREVVTRFEIGFDRHTGRVEQSADQSILDVGQQAVFVTFLEHPRQPFASEHQWHSLLVGRAEPLQPVGDQDQRGTDEEEEIEEDAEQWRVAEQALLGGAEVEVLGHQLTEEKHDRGDGQDTADFPGGARRGDQGGNGQGDTLSGEEVGDVVADQRRGDERRRVLNEPQDPCGRPVSRVRIDAQPHKAHSVEPRFRPAEEGREPESQDEDQHRRKNRHWSPPSACGRDGRSSKGSSVGAISTLTGPRPEASITRIRNPCHRHSSPTSGTRSS